MQLPCPKIQIVADVEREYIIFMLEFNEIRICS